MTRSRAKGARLERIAKRRLERNGYVVIRAAGSHGPFDLVALRARTSDAETTLDGADEVYEVLCVQVKANRKRARAQVEAMCRVPAPTEVRYTETEPMLGRSMPRSPGTFGLCARKSTSHFTQGRARERRDPMPKSPSVSPSWKGEMVPAIGQPTPAQSG